MEHKERQVHMFGSREKGMVSTVMNIGFTDPFDQRLAAKQPGFQVGIYDTMWQRPLHPLRTAKAQTFPLSRQDQ